MLLLFIFFAKKAPNNQWRGENIPNKKSSRHETNLITCCAAFHDYWARFGKCLPFLNLLFWKYLLPCLVNFFGMFTKSLTCSCLLISGRTCLFIGSCGAEKVLLKTHSEYVDGLLFFASMIRRDMLYLRVWCLLYLFSSVYENLDFNLDCICAEATS